MSAEDLIPRLLALNTEAATGFDTPISLGSPKEELTRAQPPKWRASFLSRRDSTADKKPTGEIPAIQSAAEMLDPTVAVTSSQRRAGENIEVQSFTKGILAT